MAPLTVSHLGDDANSASPQSSLRSPLADADSLNATAIANCRWSNAVGTRWVKLMPLYTNCTSLLRTSSRPGISSNSAAAVRTNSPCRSVLRVPDRRLLTLDSLDSIVLSIRLVRSDSWAPHMSIFPNSLLAQGSIMSDATSSPAASSASKTLFNAGPGRMRPAMTRLCHGCL
eukprot:5497067-Amphidinium_carterae.4